MNKETTYYQRKRGAKLNTAKKKYYEDNKEVLRKKARNKYR